MSSSTIHFRENTPTTQSILVSALPLSIFRFCFGLLMIPQVYNLLPSIHELANSIIVFHYPNLHWIEAYSHGLIDTLGGICYIAALGISLGILPRIFAGIFALCFGYLFMIDMSFYNNHYYLWCLIGLLMVMTDMHKTYSIFDLIKKRNIVAIPLINYIVFALLISIVYLYGGIVKIIPDWLQGQPMRILAHSRGWIFPDLLGYFMSYMGIIFDCGMAILLWQYAKKWWIILPYLVFHLSNYFIFNIGEFPFVMLAALSLFYPLQNYSITDIYQNAKLPFSNKLKYYILLLFFAFQLVFPLRCWLMEGKVAWHRQGYYFSWRMMLNSQEPKYFQYRVIIPEQKHEYYVDFRKIVTFRQLMNLYNNPYAIWSLAQKLKADAQQKYSTENVQVYAKALITLNQHPEQDLIRTDIDLAKVDYKLYSKNMFVTDFKK